MGSRRRWNAHAKRFSDEGAVDDCSNPALPEYYCYIVMRERTCPLFLNVLFD